MATTLTTEKYLSLLRRVTALEVLMNSLVPHIKNAITAESFSDLSTVLQVRLLAIESSITELTARVEALEDTPLS